MPKVSFYLRNEDVEKWKAIKTKTGWIHANLNDKVIFMNGQDPITVLDMSDNTAEPMPERSMVVGRREYDTFPTKEVEVVDVKDYNLCKHNAVKGMCKKGCK